MIEHYARHPDGSWGLTTWTSLEQTVPMPTLGVAVPLRDVYAKMELLPEDDAATPQPPRPPRPKTLAG